MPFRLLTILLAFSFFTESLSRLFIKEFYNPMPVYHIYAPISVMLYCGIVYLMVPRKLIQWICIIPAMIAIPFSLLNSLYLQPLDEFPSNMVLFSHILLSIYSLIIFYHLLYSPEDRSLFRNPVFWFSVGTLIFQAASFVYLGFDQPIFSKLSPEMKITISNVHLYFAMLMYAIYGLSLWLDNPRSETHHAPAE